MPVRTIALVAAGIVVFTAAVVLALWWAGTADLTGQALVTARFDALRTGLSIGIGSGGIFALYLAWRRQHAMFNGAMFTENTWFPGAIVRHPVTHSTWPAGWAISDDHGPIDDREGTWHRLVRS